MKKAWRIFIAILVSAAFSARAEEQKGELVLALYAPTAPLDSADARFGYVNKVAEQLKSAGVNVRPKVFAHSADLETAIRRAQVDLAILDAFYTAEHGNNYSVLAMATANGEAFQRWGLYSHLPSGNLLDMAGKHLAWVSPSGSKEATYINNVLLFGELKVAQFFRPSAPAPDIAAAVSDVVLRRADCVFAPEQAVQGKALRRVYEVGELGRIPYPALVQIQNRLSAETVANIKRGIVGFRSTGQLDGWRAGSGEAYHQLRQRLRAAAERNLVFAEPLRISAQIDSSMVLNVVAKPLPAPTSDLLQPPSDLP